ncbi:cupin domain-containing protein [candidate division TA06 bacterium]|nr:cupin domain-containing protein [candidate division TA06 bacterium]
MPKAINLEKCFEMFQDTFSPKIIGELNGQLVMVVKCQGDKVPWHTHENEDEMFLVMDGELEVQEKGGSATLQKGEMYIVKRGTEHRVVPKGLVKLMLFEPAGIEHTGKVKSEITKKSFERLEV